MPIFRKAPKIPEVSQPSSGAARDPYGSASGRTPTDAELEAEYGGGSGAGGRSSAPSLSSYQAPQMSSYQPQGASYQSSQPGSYQTQTYQPNDPYSTFGPEQKQALDPEEEEIESIKHEIRSTKGESLSSTRNALRLARETEETATNTMVKLGEQSDKIGDTERHLDLAKAHASRADDNARQIKQLNRSIFRPKFTWDKRAKREAEEARVLQRHIDERTERELTREEVLRSQRRVDETVSMNPLQRLKALKSQQGQSSDPNIDKAVTRSRYQFEATESDDEVEDEIDSNLNDISALSARLNHLGRAMGEEVDFQNNRLGRVGDKTSELDTRIYAGTQRLNHLR